MAPVIAAPALYSSTSTGKSETRAVWQAFIDALEESPAGPKCHLLRNSTFCMAPEGSFLYSMKYPCTWAGLI